MKKSRTERLGPKLCLQARAIALALICLGLASCSLPSQTDYPVLPAPSGSPGAQTDPQTGLDVNQPDDQPAAGQTLITLQVAGPWQSTELDLLGRYFELTRSQLSTLGHEDSNGKQISLDYLSAYASDLRLVAIPLSRESFLSDDLAREWTAAGTWPDLVLTDHYSPRQASQLLDLTPFLMDEPALAADKIDPGLLSSCFSPQGFLYLPWRLGVPLLSYQAAAFPAAPALAADQVMNWPQFVEHCHLLADVSGQTESPQVVLANPELLLPVQSGGDRARTGWTGWDGDRYDFQSQEWLNTVQALRQLVQSGMTLAGPDIGYQDYLAATEQLLSNHQAAFQVLDSSRLADWPRGRLSPQVVPLPMAASDPSAYPVHVQALSVSKASSQPALASQVAVFLAADPDALQLQLRLDPRPGLFPVIKDETVWMASLNQVPGRTKALAQLPGLLKHPSAGGSFKSDQWSALQLELTGPSGYRLLTAPDIMPELVALQQTWDPQED